MWWWLDKLKADGWTGDPGHVCNERRPARGFPLLIALLWAVAVSSHQITEVYLPLRLAGHCQIIAPHHRHVRCNVPRLINVAELATSPRFKLPQKGTQAEAVVNLHSTLRLSVVTREQRESILPLPGHYGAPIQHAGAWVVEVMSHSVCTPPPLKTTEKWERH